VLDNWQHVAPQESLDTAADIGKAIVMVKEKEVEDFDQLSKDK